MNQPYFFDLFNVDVFSQFDTAVELLAFQTAEGDDALLRSVECIITALFDVVTSVKFGAALSDDDRTRISNFSCEKLHTEALSFGVSAQTCGSAGFLMCHVSKLVNNNTVKVV